MATWSLLLGAVLNLVALLLFGVAYRAGTARARRAEWLLLGSALVSGALWAVGPAFAWASDTYDIVNAYYFGNGCVLIPPTTLSELLRMRALLAQTALVPIPAAAWLGLVALRRSRAAAP